MCIMFRTAIIIISGQRGHHQSISSCNICTRPLYKCMFADNVRKEKMKMKKNLCNFDLFIAV